MNVSLGLPDPSITTKSDGDLEMAQGAGWFGNGDGVFAGMFGP